MRHLDVQSGNTPSVFEVGIDRDVVVVIGERFSEAAEGDAVRCEDPGEAHALEQREPGDPLQRVGWRNVEIRSFTVPLLDDAIDFIHGRSISRSQDS